MAFFQALKDDVSLNVVPVDTPKVDSCFVYIPLSMGCFLGMSQHEALLTDFNEDPMDCKGPNL